MTIGAYIKLSPSGYLQPGRADFISRQPVWYQHQYAPDYEVFDYDDGGTVITAYPFGTRINSTIQVQPDIRPAGWDAPPDFTANVAFYLRDVMTTGTIRCYIAVAFPEPDYVAPPYSNVNGYTPPVTLDFTFYQDDVARVQVDSGQMSMKVIVIARHPTSTTTYDTETTTYIVDPGANSQSFTISSSHAQGSATFHNSYIQTIEVQTAAGTHVATYSPVGTPDRTGYDQYRFRTQDQVVSFDWAEDIGDA